MSLRDPDGAAEIGLWAFALIMPVLAIITVLDVMAFDPENTILDVRRVGLPSGSIVLGVGAAIAAFGAYLLVRTLQIGAARLPGKSHVLLLAWFAFWLAVEGGSVAWAGLQLIGIEAQEVA